MEDTGKLSLREFLDDIRLVIATPGRRFSLIQERGALWGSLLLLFAPAYFGFAWWGGIYFDREPFPGYSFLIPLVPVALLSLLKACGVHFLARLFEGRGLYTRGKGRFRSLLVVFGYAGIPLTLALVMGLLLFVLLPSEIGALFLGYRAVGLSLMISVSVGVFVWNLILMVLALRTVYSIRDFMLVISVLVGPPLATIPAMSMMLIVGEAKVDFRQAEPLLSGRVNSFLAAETGQSEKARFSFHMDRIVYRFKPPRAFDLAVYEKATSPETGRGGKRGFTFGVRMFRVSRHGGEQVLGRILGLPGDQVELVDGRLRLNGKDQEEPYILPEFQAVVSFPARKLGSAEYLILPENRQLLDSLRADLVVPRDRILGRALVRKWPFGWFWFRPNAFYTAANSRAQGFP